MDDDEITRAAFAAAKGDAAAARRFVAGTQRQLHRLLSYLSSPGVADDLTQETYLRAFAALSGFEGRSPARMWLLAIAKRVAADHLRTIRRRPVPAQTEDWVATAEQNGAYTPDPGRVVALRRLITELDAERRDAFVLTQVIGLSYAEAAEVCDCALGTIRSRVFRAREELTAAVRASERLAPSG
ncbi:sigma-70 family RNA polymerase sigma factor [Amycolatopsis acidiphila]|uniref:Sigma-70 family RNA polymerase sigma factor n=1 Tax=Amycolatopsis acidiphila TaxID=715473 RepID=A0A558A4F7_9PSEU|nr:sigma-70 family RNA polymerase sigma factor [Amycolatopsis acidiphila]TVT19128.1 sigma-70 family RNA polymerase sigma factor [Amycolatopsis acidiphila]UIJ58950.1 sigma-70 family RNA polymerase sigma factor [Amycolatopsis acidiphila]GHG72976.1 RNA polymerase sigma factor [Amycolatopsis acidiphila]